MSNKVLKEKKKNLNYEKDASQNKSVILFFNLSVHPVLLKTVNFDLNLYKKD